MTDLAPGDIFWMLPDPTVGREQRGGRPGLVISAHRYLESFPELAIIVPLTGTEKSWISHVAVEGEGLDGKSWAMTEQVRSISKRRIRARIGRADHDTLEECRRWVKDFLEL